MEFVQQQLLLFTVCVTVWENLRSDGLGNILFVDIATVFYKRLPFNTNERVLEAVGVP